MVFSVCLIAEQVETRFSDCYRLRLIFRLQLLCDEFFIFLPDRLSSLRVLDDLLLAAVRLLKGEDRELLSHIIFCNDLLRIPPVKTFLLYYAQDFIRMTGREDAALEPFVKKAIGAFWGMVFKFVLGYRDQESVSISLNQRFFVRTATCFQNPAEPVQLKL